MKGYYFINTDLGNLRAHTSQILHTIVPLQGELSLELVAPRYRGTPDSKMLRARHELARPPRITYLSALGFREPGSWAFVAFNLSAIAFLMARKLRRQVDFIYVRSTLFIPVALVAYALDIPFFYETHRVPQTRSEARRDEWMSARAAGLIVISRHVGRHYECYHVPMLEAHDAVSLPRFGQELSKQEARAKRGIAPGAHVCVYTGTVRKLKGVQYVIEAATQLPDVTFLLAGLVSPDIAEIPLPPNVELLGHLDQSELPALLAGADVLLLPHPKNEYSQSPMKLFEYMAAGRPIVASKLPPVEEILNERNAVLVEPEDADAIAGAIRELLADSAFAEALAQCASEDVREHTWEARGKKIAHFIREILGV